MVEIERHVAERYSSHSTPSLSLSRSTNEACGGGFQEESPQKKKKIKSKSNREIIIKPELKPNLNLNRTKNTITNQDI